MAITIFTTLFDTFVLIWINLKVKWINLLEYIHIVIHYYSNFRFAKIDTVLLLFYLFSNPFRISKKFSVYQGEEEIYTYGETPLTTLDQIAKLCDITSKDVVYELGCGRGRTCFWLNQWIGCSVVGIDYVPLFIDKANKIKKFFGLQNLHFRLEDLFQADLQGSTVIYLYGTCFSNEQIHTLIQRFSTLPAGTKIITVSYALNDFAINAPFKKVKQFTALFTWGAAEVTLQIIPKN